MPPAKEDIIGVKTYTKDLLAYTLSKVAQIEIAEDLVQETFISAYQSYEKFEERSNVKTWLFSILKHKIADYYPTKYKKSIEVPSDVVARLFNEDHGWKKEYRPVD